MRKHLATSAVAAAVLSLGGLTGFAGSAAASSPPDEPIDELPDIGAILDILSPEQIVCVMQRAGSEISDLDAAMAMLEECGISIDQIMELVPEAAPGSTTPATAVPDADTIAAVLEYFGLGSDDLTCVASGLAASTPGDDEVAFLVLQTCGISLSALLEMITAEPVR